MDLSECLKKGMIKRTAVDKELIQSLLEMAESKEYAVRTANVNAKTISAYVSLAYDSLRETLEALCILQGYKVLSHICIGELLKTALSTVEYEEFDRLRWIRNSINYYGKKVELEQGKALIEKIFGIKAEIIKKHLR